MIALLAAAALQTRGTITVPAGYYTLPQIAGRLGRGLTVQPALENRLLFVSIHEKPLAAIEQDLSDVLGVRFTRTTKGEQIQPDPDRKAQDDRLLSRLIEAYDQPCQAVMQACNSLLPTITPASIDASSDRLIAAESNPQTQGAAKMLLDLGSGDFNPLAYLCLAKGVDFDALVKHDALESGTALDLESGAPPAWADKFSLRTAIAQNLSTLPIDDNRRQELIVKCCSDSRAVLRLAFDPYTGRLAARLSVAFGPASNAGASGDFSIVPEELPVEYPKLAQIGDESYVRQYEARRKATTELLASAKDSVNLEKGSRAVSQFFAGWSAQASRDIIMEVSSGRDLSPNRFESAKSVCADPTHEILGSLADCESEVAEENPVSESPGSRSAAQASARTIAAEPTYSCRLAGDVLCVRNEFGFLDHAYQFPVEAIAKLANARLADGSDSPKLADIERYALGVDAQQAALVARFHCALVPTDVAAAWPALHAVFGSAELRSALLSVVSRGRKASLPLDAAKKLGEDLAAAAEGCEWLCGDMPTATAICLSPDLAATLADSHLDVNAFIEAGGTKFSVSITRVLTLAFPRVGPDGSLTYQPQEPQRVSILRWPEIRYTP